MVGGLQEMWTLVKTPELGGGASDGQEDREWPQGEEAWPPIQSKREAKMRQRFW